MSERNPTRRQYLLAAGASSVALLSGCSSGGDDGSGQDETQDATDAGDGSGQNGTQNTTADGGDSGDSSGGFTPWVSRYGDPQKTRATGDQQWAVDRNLMGRNAAFAVDDDRVYIAFGTDPAGGGDATADPTVAALDPADGSERWSSPVSRGTISLLATGDALVRIGERVEVLSKSNGELQRSAGIDRAVGDGNAVAGGRVYVTTVGAGGIPVYGAG